MANSKSISVISVNPSIEMVDANNKSMLIDLGVKSCKESNAAHYLVAFLLKVLGMEKSKLTDAISKSIVDLDDLAQQIDTLIDFDKSSNSKNLSYNNFKNLELNIVECFSHLTESRQLEKLIIDTLKCVNTSFKYNTVERHNIYNLENTDFRGCTTFYLFPLVTYLFSYSQFQGKSERLFFLVANYIQILDDYIDVFDDKDLQINTPLTVRYNEIKANPNFKEQNPFEVLREVVQNILAAYLKAIKEEAVAINKNIDDELFEEWNMFDLKLRTIHFPMNSNITEQKKYLKTIHGIVPPIICYIS